MISFWHRTAHVGSVARFFSTAVGCIDSMKHEFANLVRGLNTTRGREESRRFLLEAKFIDQLPSLQDVEALVIEERASPGCPDISLPAAKKYKVQQGMMTKLFHSAKMPNAFAVVRLPRYKVTDIQDAETLLVLDQLQNEKNIGAIARTAAGFGVGGMIFIGRSLAEVYSTSILRASVGMILKVPVLAMTDQEFVAFAKQSGHEVLPTSSHGGTDVMEIDLRRKCALVLGNEAVGVRASLLQSARCTIKIPLASDVESFNVAVATGILLYERKRQFVARVEQREKARCFLIP